MCPVSPLSVSLLTDLSSGRIQRGKQILNCDLSKLLGPLGPNQTLPSTRTVCYKWSFSVLNVDQSQTWRQSEINCCHNAPISFSIYLRFCFSTKWDHHKLTIMTLMPAFINLNKLVYLIAQGHCLSGSEVMIHMQKTSGLRDGHWFIVTLVRERLSLTPLKFHLKKQLFWAPKGRCQNVLQWTATLSLQIYQSVWRQLCGKTGNKHFQGADLFLQMPSPSTSPRQQVKHQSMGSVCMQMHATDWKWSLWVAHRCHTHYVLLMWEFESKRRFYVILLMNLHTVIWIIMNRVIIGLNCLLSALRWLLWIRAIELKWAELIWTPKAEMVGCILMSFYDLLVLNV